MEVIIKYKVEKGFKDKNTKESNYIIDGSPDDIKS